MLLEDFILRIPVFYRKDRGALDLADGSRST